MALRGSFWQTLGQGIAQTGQTLGAGLTDLDKRKEEERIRQEELARKAPLEAAQLGAANLQLKGMEQDQAAKDEGKKAFAQFMGKEGLYGKPETTEPALLPGVPMLNGPQLTPEQKSFDMGKSQSALERLYGSPEFSKFGATSEAKQYESGLKSIEELKDKDLERELKLITAGLKKGVKSPTQTDAEFKMMNAITDNMKQDPMVIKAKQIQTYLPAMDAIWTNLTPEQKNDPALTAPVDNALTKFSTLIIEPGLAVREDDLRAIVGSQAKLEELRAKLIAIQKGGLGYDPKFRTSLVDMSRKIAQVVTDNYKTRLDFYNKQAERFGVETSPDSGGIFDKDQWGIIRGSSGVKGAGNFDIDKMTDAEIAQAIREGRLKP
jgi:hypothetical protein